jgi:hypothetical protein
MMNLFQQIEEGYLPEGLVEQDLEDEKASLLCSNPLKYCDDGFCDQMEEEDYKQLLVLESEDNVEEFPEEMVEGKCEEEFFCVILEEVPVEILLIIF